MSLARSPAFGIFMSSVAPPFDAFGFSPFPVWRFTVEEYHRLAESGVLEEDHAVELLEGWIVPKMIHNPPHDAAVELAQAAVSARLPQGWRPRIQSAITTSDSEPEPPGGRLRIDSGPRSPASGAP
jgi:hypothetical protein